MWKWKDTDELISEEVSGQYGNFLNVTVARDDRFREIIALYNNTIGHVATQGSCNLLYYR